MSGKTIYRITEYGDTADFDSLDAAERVIRDCGGDFAEVALSIPTRTGTGGGRSGLDGDIIRDQSGAAVGVVIEV